MEEFKLKTINLEMSMKAMIQINLTFQMKEFLSKGREKF